MSGNFVGNNSRVEPKNLSGTSAVTVYTATGYPQIIGIRLCNRTGTAVNGTVTMVRDGTTYTLLFQHSVPANGQIWLALEAFALVEGDEIRCTQGTDNSLSVFLSIAEVPGRSG